MTVVDIGLILSELAARTHATPTRLWGLTESPHSAWSLIHVAGRDRWEAPEAQLDERQLLVLEGKATVEVDDWRQTLGSGHLVTAEPGARLAIINETAGAPLVALFGTTRGPTPLSALGGEEE